MNVSVIGGGISGLYFTYLYSQKYPSHQIILFEKNDFFGGRIQTHQMKFHGTNYLYEKGAARFNQNHTILLHLIDELGLKKKIVPIPANIHYQPISGKVIMEEPYAYIQKVYNYRKKHLKEDITNQSYIEYAKKVLQPEEIRELENSFGYSAELNVTNAEYAINLFQNDFHPKNQFYALKGGLSQIIDTLVKILKKRKNVKLFLHTEIKDVSYHSSLYTIQTSHQIIHSHSIVFALPKPFLQKFSILKEISKDLNKICCIPLLRYYSIYPKEKDGKLWFDGLGKTTTNHWMRYIIPIDAKTGLVMISYTDSEYAKSMKRRMDDGKDEEGIEEGIKKIFGKNVKKPLYSDKVYWDCGVGLWKKGNFHYKDVSNRMIEPLPKKYPKMYIVGENYSMNQGWIEGALESVGRLMEKC
jgi:protoporphyrinogen oxidase